jgi:hypothetical protein
MKQDAPMIDPEAAPPAPPFYDHSTTCQRCHQKVRLGSSTPEPIDLNYVCMRCRSADRYE